MENIITIEYNELDDDIKEKVRDHFRNDAELVPDDWYEWHMEGISEKYEGLEIDKESITYDMYYNDFGWEGEVDFTNEKIMKLMPKKLFEYDKNEMLYEYDNTFKDGEMNGEYRVDTDNIYRFIVEDVFPFDVDIDRTGESEISINDFRGPITKAIEKYKEYSIDVENILKKWLNLMDAAELFFQSTITITEEDYDFVIDDLTRDIEQEVERFMEEECYDKLNDYVSNAFDDFTESLKESYEYYFSDEYADEVLSERTFEVVIDEDEEQIEVVDLNGDY